MKTVMVFGTFDIIHGGHLHMFKQACEYGDKLIVAVARDCNVKKNKGIKPLHDEKERKSILKHIDLIDKVVLGYKTEPYRIIKDYKPDVIALGYDQKEYVDNLTEAIDKFEFKTKIVRLRPYKKDKFKTSKIKKYIERLV